MVREDGATDPQMELKEYRLVDYQINLATIIPIFFGATSAHCQ